MQLNALIGKKTYQKQGFLQDGTRVPLTGVVVAGNIVTQIKTQDKEGYNALQLGVDAKKRANKAILGHASKASKSSAVASEDKTPKAETKTINPKYFKEVRIEDTQDAALGTQIDVAEVFAPGDIIDVTGVSKGKGWAGGVKRWGFHGGPRTHGQSDRERAPGSIGQTTTPGRVYKGKKMAGRMGSDTVTVKNLEIIEITNDGVLLIKGLVPGRVNSLLMVKKVGENKKFVPLYREATEEPQEEAPAVEAEAPVTETPATEAQVEAVTAQPDITIETEASKAGDVNPRQPQTAEVTQSESAAAEPAETSKVNEEKEDK